MDTFHYTTKNNESWDPNSLGTFWGPGSQNGTLKHRYRTLFVRYHNKFCLICVQDLKTMQWFHTFGTPCILSQVISKSLNTHNITDLHIDFINKLKKSKQGW